MANKKTATKSTMRMLSLFAAICVASAAVSTAAFAASFTYDKYIELGAETFDDAVVHQTQNDGKKGNVGAYDETTKSGKSRISYNHANRVEMDVAEETIQGKKNKYLKMNKTTSGQAYAYALFYPIDTDTAFEESGASAVDDNEYIVRFRVRLGIIGGSLDFTCGAFYKIDYQRNIKIGNTSTGESINEGEWNDIEIKINKTQAKSWLTVNKELLSESEGDDISAFAHNYIKFSMGQNCSGKIELDDFAVSGIFVQNGTETVANEPVAVKFKEISAGGIEASSADEPMTFDLEASAVSGIGSVEAYADGTPLSIVQTGDATESLVDMGEHFAMCSANTYKVTVPAEVITESPEITAQLTSTAGNTAETSFKINYRPILTKDLFELQDFENITISTGTDYDKDAIKTGEYQGKVATENGSLVVSNCTDKTNENGARVAFYVNEDKTAFKGKFVFECDTHIVSSDKTYQMNLRVHGKNESNVDDKTFISKFLPGGMQLQDDTSNKTTVEYDEDKKLKIKLEIDTTEKTCTVYTFDNKTDTMMQRGKVINLVTDNVEYIQVMLSATANTNEIHLDNVHMYISEKRPAIAVEDESLIKTADKSVTAAIDGNLNSASITVDSVLEDGTKVEGSVKLLTESGKEIVLESAEYSAGKLTVKPSRKLMSNKSYTIVVTGEAEVSEGLPLGTEIKTTFTVPKENIFVDTVGFANQEVDGTAMKKATVVLSNHLGETKTVCVVMTAYKNGKQVGFSASEESVPAGGATVYPMVKAQEGATYEVYIYDSWRHPKYIANRLFAQ